MTEKTVLEWQYEPSNYFEAPYSYSHPAYELIIKEGKALATLANPQEVVDPTLIAAIEEKVKTILAGRQLLLHEPFTLGFRCTYQLQADGTKGVAVHVAKITSSIRFIGSVDAVVRNVTGQVIRDTKAERIAEHTRFLDVVATKGQ